MSVKKIAIVLVIMVMSLCMVACTAVYSASESQDVLQNAMTKTFEAKSSYITIKYRETFNAKTMSGEPKVDKDGKPVTEDKLVPKFIINTYITEDTNYPAGTRLSEIHEITHDTMGRESRVQYWAGKEKGGTQSYLVKKMPVELKDGENTVKRTTYYRQKIDNENIFEMDEFKKYDKRTVLSDWVNLTKDDYTVVSGKKAGGVDTIVITINEAYSPKLHAMGEFSIRITNGYLACIENTKSTPAGDTIVEYRIDYLLAGQYITLPTTATLTGLENPTNEAGAPLKDAAGNNALAFYDNATLVK